jgi:hypothetical protein
MGLRGKSCESECSNSLVRSVRSECEKSLVTATQFHPLRRALGVWGVGSRLRLALSPCSSLQGSYLVDPASSHMLVSKIKPCMSKYKLLIL